MLPLHVETHGNVPPVSDSGKTPSARTRPLATETTCNMRRRFFVAGSVRYGSHLEHLATAPIALSHKQIAAKLARIDRIREPAALREHSAHVTRSHARPVSLCGVLRPPIVFLSSRARCARPGGVWRVTRRVFVPVPVRYGPFCSGMFRFAPRALSSRTLSALRTSSVCH